MILVHASDRVWRHTLASALRASRQDVALRLSGRPAELAKMLADAGVQVIVVSPLPDDAHIVREQLQHKAATITVLYTTPGDAMEVIARRALASCTPSGQTTSSA